MLLAALRRAIERRGRHSNFAETDITAATKYAQGVFSEALSMINRNSSVNRR